jgi:hypothetical protein
MALKLVLKRIVFGTQVEPDTTLHDIRLHAQPEPASGTAATRLESRSIARSVFDVHRHAGPMV